MYKFPIEGCLDIASANGNLYIVSRLEGGYLAVFSPDGVELARVGQIGNVRQLALTGSLLAVSAREDGLWLFDITETTPRLLSHYRTVELATGVTMHDGYCFVSCRQYGIEVIDIRNPRAPRYAGLIRIGEVQSACVSGHYLYGGVWGKMKVVCVDIADLSAPKILSEMPLGGRGDGVAVIGNTLYASCGQHAPGIVNIIDPEDPCFGHGNGLDVFDVSDPAHPVLKYHRDFGYGYCTNFDMWRPNLSGDSVLCNNSILGVFGVDAATGEIRFACPAPKTDEPAFLGKVCTSIDTGNGMPDPVTGLTVCDGKLFFTAYKTGVWCLDEGHFDDIPLCDGTVRTVAVSPVTSNRPEYSFVDRGDYPVCGICSFENGLAVACGEDGIHLRRDDGTLIEKLPTGGICCGIDAAGGLLCSASADAGLELFCRIDGKMTRLSSLSFKKTVMQVRLSRGGLFAAVILGSTGLAMVDLTDPAHPTVAFDRMRGEGPFYGENFLPLAKDGTMSLFRHRDGLIRSDPEAGDRDFSCIHYLLDKGFTGFGPANGCDTDGERYWFATGGLLCELPTDRGQDVNLNRLPPRIADRDMAGKISFCDDLLIITERAKGKLAIFDLTAPDGTRKLLSLSGCPGFYRAVKIRGRIWLPAGRDGLAVLSQESLDILREEFRK